MSTGLYHSTQSVPTRVDVAWRRGYEAGRQEWKRLALVAVLVAAYELVKRHRVPVPVKVLVAYGTALLVLLAVCAAPFVLLALVVSAGVRRRPRKPFGRSTRSRSSQTGVLLDDGTVF